MFVDGGCYSIVPADIDPGGGFCVSLDRDFAGETNMASMLYVRKKMKGGRKRAAVCHVKTGIAAGHANKVVSASPVAAAVQEEGEEEAVTQRVEALHKVREVPQSNFVKKVERVLVVSRFGARPSDLFGPPRSRRLRFYLVPDLVVVRSCPSFFATGSICRCPSTSSKHRAARPGAVRVSRGDSAAGKHGASNDIGGENGTYKVVRTGKNQLPQLVFGWRGAAAGHVCDVPAGRQIQRRYQHRYRAGSAETCSATSFLGAEAQGCG